MAKKDTDNEFSKKGTSPVGIAIFPKLFEPDYEYTPDGTYSVKLKLDEKTAKPLVKDIEGIIAKRFAAAESECKNAREKAALKEAQTKSYKVEVDENNDPTGYVLFNFKMKASGISKKTGKRWTRKPSVFDGQGKPIVSPDYKVWSGSEIRVAYELRSFNTQALGVGCSCNLIACQILKLNTGQSRDAGDYGFDADEGAFDSSGMQEAVFGESVRDTDTGVDGNVGGGADNDGDF